MDHQENDINRQFGWYIGSLCLFLFIENASFGAGTTKNPIACWNWKHEWCEWCSIAPTLRRPYHQMNNISCGTCQNPHKVKTWRKYTYMSTNSTLFSSTAAAAFESDSLHTYRHTKTPRLKHVDKDSGKRIHAHHNRAMFCQYTQFIHWNDSRNFCTLCVTFSHWRLIPFLEKVLRAKVRQHKGCF